MGGFQKIVGVPISVGNRFLLWSSREERRHNAGALKCPLNSQEQQGFVVVVDRAEKKFESNMIFGKQRKLKISIVIYESFFVCFKLFPLFGMYIDLGSIAVSAEIQNQQQPNSSRNERLRASQT